MFDWCTQLFDTYFTKKSRDSYCYILYGARHCDIDADNTYPIAIFSEYELALAEKVTTVTIFN